MSSEQTQEDTRQVARLVGELQKMARRFANEQNYPENCIADLARAGSDLSEFMRKMRQRKPSK